MANIIAIGGGASYKSGTLTTIDSEHKINVNMTKSTPANIEQESRENPNVLFYTEGTPGGGLSTVTVTLSANGWDEDDNAQTVQVTGVTASNHVLVSPSPTSIYDYAVAGIAATTQGQNQLTFICWNIPENDIDVNIAYWED